MFIFKHTASNYKCKHIRAFATSAVREADNGIEFIDTIKAKTGIEVAIIDGQREAELIFRGVKQTVDLSVGTALIMDIGGGSTEFILCDAEGILWKNSFPLGVSRITEIMELPDPLGHSGVQELEAMLDEALAPLWEACKNKAIDRLIGSSGSFDTFKDMVNLAHGDREVDVSDEAREIDVRLFNELAALLMKSSMDERTLLPGMQPSRAETLQVSAVMLRKVMNKLQIKSLYRSRFALKEGAMQWLLESGQLERSL
jgi:exopolyphosphatase/guanosine-5'-triphosphate,3'-diphosphate pyrophosphatase